ncbi:MAG: alkaline phosphatase family protein [Gammaproteobacteria bacterium]|nr:alkaline phosphatase family protein [Gammaproteobacteria bacterium]
MQRPDYVDNSIVNLMASISAALGGRNPDYSPLAYLSQDEIRSYKKVMLLVIDGLGHDTLLQANPGGFLARHTRARITSVCPTTTASALTVFSSGKAPLQHGLTGWFSYFRELGSITAVLPFIARHGGLPYDQQNISLDSILGWSSVFNTLQCPTYTLLPRYIYDSHFSQQTSGSAVRLGYDDFNDCLSQAQGLLHHNVQPIYLYAYWSELDRLGHAHGINSQQVSQHLAELDQAIEQFANHLPTDTLLLITADHGQLDSSEDKTILLEDHPPLAECMTMPLSGEPRLAYCYVHTDKQHQFTNYIQQHLSHCCTVFSREEMLAQNLFGLGQPHPELEHRIGDYALVMKENYIIRDIIAGERPFTMVGVHGGLSDAELFVPLVVWPPSHHSVVSLE